MLQKVYKESCKEAKACARTFALRLRLGPPDIRYRLMLRVRLGPPLPSDKSRIRRWCAAMFQTKPAEMTYETYESCVYVCGSIIFKYRQILRTILCHRARQPTHCGTYCMIVLHLQSHRINVILVISVSQFLLFLVLIQFASNHVCFYSVFCS